MKPTFYIELNAYDKLEKIGEGNFGYVFKIRHKESNEKFAAKISKTEINYETSPTILEALNKEINNISKLNHRTIVEFIGFNEKNFENEFKPTIVTEYLKNDSLQTLIDNQLSGRTPDNWTETKKLINIYGIASAMKYLHENGIIHRDLKPSNILLDESLYPRICDFGFSTSKEQQKEEEMVGTYLYLAPEIIKKEDNPYSEKSDVYAFSFILYEMLTLQKPFNNLKTLTK